MQLNDGLILRSIRDEHDIDRYAAFGAAVVDAIQGATCARLPRYRPDAAYEDFLFVEDQQTGEIVSTVCLLPWRCVYEGVVLNVAMLEMVATHPAYRQRGLVRAQIERFHQMTAERGFDCCIIEGIPYYYRQYGYAYAIEHGAYDSLPAWRIPSPPAGQSAPYRLRPATVDDAPVLASLYKDHMAVLQCYTLRSADYWRYLIQWAHYPVQIVEAMHDGQAAGYVCVMPLARGRGVKTPESGIAGYAAGMTVLQTLKQEYGADIQLGWPQTNTLTQIGRSLGSTPLPADQWLLRITDVAGFLTKLAPVFEQRLARSDCAGLTANLCVNLFRHAFVLHFTRGKLERVAAVGFVDASMGADGGDLCIPPDAFVRLVFGYRDLDELHDAWPDITIKPASRRLLEILFPKVAAYFCMPYLVHEPAG